MTKSILINDSKIKMSKKLSKMRIFLSKYNQFFLCEESCIFLIIDANAICDLVCSSYPKNVFNISFYLI